jgi:acetylornithine deacetylase/succinyl-diaminopimelate desuccinylase-like protein
MSRLCVLLLLAIAASAQTPDWPKANAEALRHFRALVQLDTTDPPGNETRAVEYVKKVLDAEGIPAVIAAKDPRRANLIARLKGNGSKRPLLIMGHTDTVRVDPAKWKFPPFSATMDGGYIYGRGTLDDKDNLTTAMMTMVMLKRLGVPLDRDVIFVAESGEEADTGPGIEYLVKEHFAEIDAEICLAEGGYVSRRNGQPRFSMVQTAEKLPVGVKLVAHGPAGHGSRPLRTSAVLHLSRAVQNIAMWDPPMRFNDTTRYYFEKMATLGDPEDAARFNGLFNPEKAPAIREYLAEHDPGHYSMLHTSISPNIVSGGYQINVIPSTAEATLDVRALPDEDVPAFYEQMRKVINDPAVELIPVERNVRPRADPSRIDTATFKTIEAVVNRVYGVSTVPVMSTGATDMAFLRAKGIQCYGIGSAMDVEDAPKGFGAHSDQERIREDALYDFLRFNWEAVTALAATPR